jgi:hypothetical protein
MRRDPDGKSLDLQASFNTLQSPVLSFKALSAYWTLTEADALMPLLAGRTSWPAAIADWRARGGTVKAGSGALPPLLEPLL